MAYRGLILRLVLGALVFIAVFTVGQIRGTLNLLKPVHLLSTEASFDVKLPGNSTEETRPGNSIPPEKQKEENKTTIADPNADIVVAESPSLCRHPLIGLEQSFCAPRLFIGGAKKCGTNTAMRILQLHPRARFKTCPDPQNVTDCTLFNYQGVRDPGVKYYIWESQHLPTPENLHAIAKRLPETDGQNNVTFDKRPDYFLTHIYPDVASQMRQMMPGTKMVFTLCDPAERLFSEFNHMRRLDDFRLTPNIPLPSNFSEFMNVMNESADICQRAMEDCKEASERYMRSGRYSEHLKKWFEAYPKSDVLVIEMTAGIKANAKKLLDFAGLPMSEYPWGELKEEPAYRNTETAGYSGREAAWAEYPKEMKMLSSVFFKSNKDLAELLDAKFPLDWKSSKQL